ncbi:MAG: NAD(P)H-hydrate dehydratase [Francisellaceae bacterium]|nr:NAD(P)H-hydrate dehydratase [Francisellaceae bacterium]
MESVFDKKGLIELENAIIKKRGCTHFDLMKFAATACCDFIKDYWPKIKSVTVVCGHGKNGGDGYLVANQLMGSYAVNVISVEDTSKINANADVLKAYKLFVGNGGKVSVFTTINEFKGDLIVDAIFGTGLSKPLSAKYNDLINKINTLSKPVCSIDLPSGLDANTGIARDNAIVADATVTLLAHKVGLLTGDAKNYIGYLHLSDLNLPVKDIVGIKEFARLLSFDKVLETRPYRLSNVHKNQVGQVAIVGGNESMLGSVLLAAKGALRMGAGRVNVFTAPEHANLIPLNQPEIVSYAVSDFNILIEQLYRMDAIVVGPGLGRDDWARGCLSAVLSMKKAMVIDADALCFLADLKDLHFSPEDVVLTPHLGEAHYLLQSPIEKLYQDRITCVNEIAKKFNATTLLKGAGTLISSSKNRLSICPYGNAGMASAGMGDLLSGVIGSLLSQGMDGYKAACLGSVLHAVAGEIKYETLGNGLLASDLLDEMAGFLVGSSNG